MDTEQTLSQKEYTVCRLIYDSLKPYMPSNDNRYVIAQQLPLAILCNDILTYSGCPYYTRCLCPRVKFSTKKALRLNARSLYQVSKRPFLDNLKNAEFSLTPFGYDGQEIDSEDMANRNRDAMFNAFFDINAINNITNLYSLQFAHNITIMPGLKTAHILGTRKKPRSKTDAKNETFTTNVLENPSIIDESKKPLSTLKEQVKQLQASVNEAKAQKEQISKTILNGNFTAEIKLLKSTWKHSNEKTNLYRNISDLKKARDDLFHDLKENNAAYKKNRQLLHISRMAVRYRDQIRKKEMAKSATTSKIDSEIPEEQVILVGRHGHGLAKAENCRFDEQCDLFTDLVFGSTDNGIVTMTETVSFDMNRFMFHLELYRAHHSTGEFKEEEVNEIIKKYSKPNVDLYSIPTSFKVKNGDVDVSSGLWRLRYRLERLKKKDSVLGQKEKELYELSKSAFLTSNEFRATFLKQKELGSQLRSFYLSTGRLRKKKQVKMQHKNYKKKVCSNERKYCVKHKGKILLVVSPGNHLMNYFDSRW